MAVETTSNTTIDVRLNRASIGTAEYTFAILNPGGGRVLVGHVPRKNITLDEQPIDGDYLTGKLKVNIITELTDSILVETEIERDQTIQMKIAKSP